MVVVLLVRLRSPPEPAADMQGLLTDNRQTKASPVPLALDQRCPTSSARKPHCQQPCSRTERKRPPFAEVGCGWSDGEETSLSQTQLVPEHRLAFVIIKDGSDFEVEKTVPVVGPRLNGREVVAFTD